MFLCIFVYNYVCNLFGLTEPSFCIDAAGVHEERDVRFTGFLLCPGSVPHTHNEVYDSLPQCCLVNVLLLL